jgi:hypothetical protein
MEAKHRRPAYEEMRSQSGLAISIQNLREGIDETFLGFSCYVTGDVSVWSCLVVFDSKGDAKQVL